LMMDPPKQLPAALERRLQDVDGAAGAHSARMGSRVIAACFLFVPLALWCGVIDWPLFGLGIGLLGLTALDAHRQSKLQRPNELVPLILGAIQIVLLSRMFSPFVLAPAMIAGFVVGVGGLPRLIDRPALVLSVALGAFLAPFALEAIGVFSPTWEFTGGHLELSSRLVHLTGTPAIAFLIGSNVILLGGMCAFMRAQNVSRRNAQRQIEIQAWQLQQLLPAPPPSAELEALIAADCD